MQGPFFNFIVSIFCRIRIIKDKTTCLIFETKIKNKFFQ